MKPGLLCPDLGIETFSLTSFSNRSRIGCQVGRIRSLDWSSAPLGSPRTYHYGVPRFPSNDLESISSVHAALTNRSPAVSQRVGNRLVLQSVLDVPLREIRVHVHAVFKVAGGVVFEEGITDLKKRAVWSRECVFDTAVYSVTLGELTMDCWATCVFKCSSPASALWYCARTVA